LLSDDIYAKTISPNKLNVLAVQPGECLANALGDIRKRSVHVNRETLLLDRRGRRIMRDNSAVYRERRGSWRSGGDHGLMAGDEPGGADGSRFEQGPEECIGCPFRKLLDDRHVSIDVRLVGSIQVWGNI
jgi:hypothetical protein